MVQAFVCSCPAPCRCALHATHQLRCLDLSSFVGLAEIQCVTLDPVRASVVTFPLLQWLTDGECRFYSLVLLGPSMYGKSALSATLGCVLARSLYEGAEDGEPYYLRIGTMDSVRSLNGENASGVPVIVDEFTPNLCSPRPDVDSMKKLMDVSDAQDLHCRHFNAQFAPRQPRIFSSNQPSPDQWLAGLPRSLATMTQQAIRELVRSEADTAAILRRTAFALVTRPLVPAELADGFKAARKEEAAKRIRACLAQMAPRK